jgi:modification methylase
MTDVIGATGVGGDGAADHVDVGGDGAADHVDVGGDGAADHVGVGGDGAADHVDVGGDGAADHATEDQAGDGAPSAPSNGRTGHVNGRRKRVPTATSRFGVSKRENHDASAFYERFPAPEITDDEHVNPPSELDRIWVGDARQMDGSAAGGIADGSVALVVTSPPYFAGKAYEEAIGEGHIPESYVSYLRMLRDVFAECRRKLQPGGRIAVNVANLGRKPYRSLSGDVITVLQELGFLVRGEIVWIKGKAAGGSCAWGSFQQPGSPTLRDVTERIVVASNGRLNRAVSARQRAEQGLPAVSTITADEFMDLTTDVWDFPPESATRVGHPAPFPVELPRRLIDLYTYEGELVLDPFMGAGTTAVAALRTGRHYVGFDTDGDYVTRAEARIADERRRLAAGEVAAPWQRIGLPPRADKTSATLDHALRHGRKVKDVARLALEEAGFESVVVNDRGRIKPIAGVDIDLTASDRRGNRWHVLLAGSFSASNPGLRRVDTLWRTLGRASALAPVAEVSRVLVLTTDMPSNGTALRTLLSLVGREPGQTITDVIRLDDADHLTRLATHARNG